MKKVFIAFFIVFLFNFHYVAVSAEANNWESDFAAATELIRANEYDRAISILQRYVLEVSEPLVSQQALLLLTRIYINKNELRNADFVIKIFKQNHPESDLMGKGLYLEGLIKEKQGEKIEAYSLFSQSLLYSQNPNLNRHIVRKIENKILADHFSYNELEILYNRFKHIQTVAHLYLFGMVRSSFNSKNYILARNNAQEYLQQFRGYKFHDEVSALLRDAERVEDGALKIAFLLPLSGGDAAFGREVLNSFAVLQKQTDVEIQHQVFDTKGDPVETIERAKEILRIGGFHAIVGPISSMDVLVASAIISQHDIPLITPTATEDGIARIGDNIYQVNLTIEKLGERIALHATDSLNLREFLIIAPNNSYGQIQAKSFRNHVESRGARVVHTQWYTPGMQDFREPLTATRRVLLKNQLERQNFQRGVVAEVAPNAITSRMLSDEDIKIDGIFVPAADPAELVMLVPQILYYRISGNLLGSSGWYSNRIITDLSRHANNAHFSLYFYRLDRYEKRVRFEDDYKALFNTRPDKVAYLGYDAINIVVQAFKSGNRNARSINNFIANLYQHQGVSGDITFRNTGGANSNAEIIKIENNTFRKVD